MELTVFNNGTIPTCTRPDRSDTVIRSLKLCTIQYTLISCAYL